MTACCRLFNTCHTGAETGAVIAAGDLNSTPAWANSGVCYDTAPTMPGSDHRSLLVTVAVPLDETASRIDYASVKLRVTDGSTGIPGPVVVDTVTFFR